MPCAPSAVKHGDPRLTHAAPYAYAFTPFAKAFEYHRILKTSARPQPDSEPASAAPAAPQGVAGIDSARRRLDDAVATLEKETVARIAEVRAEAGAKTAVLETEIAKLKAAKRSLERTTAELRKAAESAGSRVDDAIANVRSVLGETAGG